AMCLPRPGKQRVNRRTFLGGLGFSVLAAARSVSAQQLGKVHRVGVLWPGASPPSPPRMDWFRQGLQGSGYVEGPNLTIDLRYAEEGERLRELAYELVISNVHVIAAFGDLGPRMAQRATIMTPIVALADDFVGSGLVGNLARPDRNTTGVSILAPELSAKRLQVLTELVPKISRVAILWDPATPSQLKAIEDTAASLRLTLQVLKVHGRNDLTPAFQIAKTWRAEGVDVLSSPLLASLSHAIIDLAAKYRLPAIYQWREQVEAGGLISYGASLAAMWQQTAKVVGNVLKGANPADLPVEQPAKFELVINLKTAKA